MTTEKETRSYKLPVKAMASIIDEVEEKVGTRLSAAKSLEAYIKFHSGA